MDRKSPTLTQGDMEEFLQLIHQEFQHLQEWVNFLNNLIVYFVGFCNLILSFLCNLSIQNQQVAHAKQGQMASSSEVYH